MTEEEKKEWSEMRKKGEFYFIFVRSLFRIGLPYAVVTSLVIYFSHFGFTRPNWNSWDFQKLILQWGAAGAMFGLVMGYF